MRRRRLRRAGDDVVAFAEGRADGSLRVRLINLGINPLEEGDVLVTSGAGGLYKPGVAVAMVSEVTRDGAIARLLANPAAWLSGFYPKRLLKPIPSWFKELTHEPAA